MSDLHKEKLSINQRMAIDDTIDNLQTENKRLKKKLDAAEKKNTEKGLANVALVRKIKEVEKEKTELCKYYTKNQMLKDDMIDLVSENTRKTKALEKIKNKAWDYTSPANAEKVRVFAAIIHKDADKALNPRKK